MKYLLSLLVLVGCAVDTTEPGFPQPRVITPADVNKTYVGLEHSWVDSNGERSDYNNSLSTRVRPGTVSDLVIQYPTAPPDDLCGITANFTNDEGAFSVEHSTCTFAPCEVTFTGNGFATPGYFYWDLNMDYRCTRTNGTIYEAHGNTQFTSYIGQ